MICDCLYDTSENNIEMKKMSNRALSAGSQVVHAGLPAAKQGRPFMDGPAFASTFHLSGDVDVEKHQYARFSNPTWSALEQAIGELEQGRAIVFPSGMSAAAGVMTALVGPGDTIILPSDAYYASRAYAEYFLAKFGVILRFVPTLEIPEQDFSDVRLVFIECPSNPMLEVVDIALLAKRVHASGGLLAIDNTTLTALGQQPLLLGADISMCSDTKSFNGHSDVVFGHVAVKDELLAEKILTWRKLSGSIPGPMETWLVHRGLATLDMRLERMTTSAQKIAEYLAEHPNIITVRYPGLVNDPSYTMACKQMNHFGFIISFELASASIAEQFLQGSQLIFEATSFGGVHTMAERRARWGTDDIAEGVIRLSVGCESLDDLLDDIKQSLNNLST